MKRFLKRLGYVLLAGVLTIILVLAGLILAPVVYNNGLLARFENSIKKLPINIVATEAQVGGPRRSGNYCDMEVIALVHYDTPVESFAKELAALLPQVRYPFDPGYPWLYEKTSDGWTLIGVITEEGVHIPFDDFGLERQEIRRMDSLLARHPGSGYRMMLFSDQAYSGFSMYDWRCY